MPATPAISLAWVNPDEPSAQQGTAVDGTPMTVDDLRKQFTDYATVKVDEIAEQVKAWNYYHGRQWAPEEIAVLRERGQPAVVFNLLGKKINGLVGTVGKMKGDPKAFGRTEQGDAGADLATQCVRYVLDASRMEVEDEAAARQACVAGIGVFELREIAGDVGDPDFTVSQVDARTFFYDPKSLKADFGDARFIGVSKMMTPDEVGELFPDKVDAIEGEMDGGGETAFDEARSSLWFGQASGGKRRTIRLVEHWYRQKGEWWCCFYAGTTELYHAASPYLDDNGKTIPRLLAFSAHVDIDGTRYGFVRDMIGPQDAINQHRSKAVHIMNARQVIIDIATVRAGGTGIDAGGTGQNIEDIRREVARPDGVITWNSNNPNAKPPVVQQMDAGFLQQTQYYQDATEMIANFGPNPALVAQSPQDMSGRALAIMQQAGTAELGGFLAAYRGCKLRLYRTIWTQVQRAWTAERTIRVTRDETLTQYLTINKQVWGQVDQFGRPAIVNAIGALDVDIIMDEGPDTVTVMGDNNDLLQALGNEAPPQVKIELSNAPRSVKDKVLAMMNQPDPAKQAMQQATIQKTQAEAQARQADAEHSHALAAVETLAASHAHADRLVQSMRGGIDAQLPINAMQQPVPLPDRGVPQPQPAPPQQATPAPMPPQP